MHGEPGLGAGACCNACLWRLRCTCVAQLVSLRQVLTMWEEYFEKWVRIHRSGLALQHEEPGSTAEVRVLLTLHA